MSSLISLIDLIRHGKHHNHHREDPPAPEQSSNIPSPKQPDQNPPVHREAVEKIVQEEREAKTQMPVYKGLENFKLLEKMGEYVRAIFAFFPFYPSLSFSGAFSNVYKALDISTGKKVAGALL